MKSDTQKATQDGETITKLFPQKLMGMLFDPTNHEAISWLPHGRSFAIFNREKFSEIVLPKYFRKSKYASFTRKLNRWNFKRVTKGPDAGAYYHEFFQRGKESLCIQMYCKNDRFKFATSEDNTKSNTSAPSNDSSTKKTNDNIKIESMNQKLYTPALAPTAQLRALLAARQQNQMQLARLLMGNSSLAFPPQLIAQQQKQRPEQQQQHQQNTQQRHLSQTTGIMAQHLQAHQKQHQLSQEKCLLELQLSLMKMKQRQEEALKQQVTNMRASAA
eukprot:CAMPEP_0194200880 /NCGR_PEP_ID=MMETSP0156-20130528/1320_1 /TAXON_ID=33649 /ORGANISM="Thalassionema nitzschioides, Strain L26-B" /LENGTH=273 /DNA_ID=CAMNT_0038925947 /DNA_START=49 /DNA_END=870 /DNA_ORIENTATION=-